MKNQKEKLRNKPVHHGNESKKKTRNKFAYLKKKGFPDSSAGKEPPAIWDSWVQSLRWEDPLEKGKVTHSSILAWRIPWT